MDEQQQAQYDALEAEKATLNPDNPDDKFRLTVIQQEQDKLTAQASEQARLQQQAEAVATVTLPQDYDALWGVSGANDEIISLIRQAYETAFAAGNDELAQLQEDFQAKLSAVESDKTALAGQVADLQADLDTANAQAQQAAADKQTAEEHLADAESKRDNAVAQMEEAQSERDKATAQVSSLKSQIDELEGMLRTYKSRSAGGSSFGGLSGLKFTSTIKSLSDEELKAKQEHDRIEQLNKFLARRGSDPLPLPPYPAATSEAAATSEETAQDDRFSVDQADVDAVGMAEGDEPVEVAGEDAQELTLEQKVDALWAWKQSFEPQQGEQQAS